MHLGASFQIVALCKFGFYCHGSLLLSLRYKFCFGNGNIKDVRNVDSTVHMYVVSICKLALCLHSTALAVGNYFWIFSFTVNVSEITSSKTVSGFMRVFFTMVETHLL